MTTTVTLGAPSLTGTTSAALLVAAFGSNQFPQEFQVANLVSVSLNFPEANLYLPPTTGGTAQIAVVTINDEDSLKRLGASIDFVAENYDYSALLNIQPYIGAGPVSTPQVIPITVQQFNQLSDRPLATVYGPGQCQIITSTYQILSVSDGKSWFSYGKSDLLGNMPSAAALGEGQWISGNQGYISNGLTWSDFTLQSEYKAPLPMSDFFRLLNPGGEDASITFSNPDAAWATPRPIFTTPPTSTFPQAALIIYAEPYDVVRIWISGTINPEGGGANPSNGIALQVYSHHSAYYRNMADDTLGLAGNSLSIFYTNSSGTQEVTVELTARIMPGDITTTGQVYFMLYGVNVGGSGTQNVTFNGNPDGTHKIFSWGVENLRSERRRLLTPNFTTVASNALTVGYSYTITNPNGLNWTTVGAPNSNIGTWFTASGTSAGTGGAADQDNSWEGNGLQSPAVWQDITGLWNMLYMGGPRNPAIGLATANHPLGNWTKYANNPVLGQYAKGYPNASMPSVLYENGTLYLYVQINGNICCFSGTNPLTMEYKGIVFHSNSNPRLVAVENPQIVHQGGIYYLYFCSMDNSDNGYWKAGVAVSTVPYGPFTAHSGTYPSESGTFNSTTGRYPITELGIVSFAQYGPDWVGYTNNQGSGLWTMVLEACPDVGTSGNANDFPTYLYAAHSTDGINWAATGNIPLLYPLTNTFGYDQVANADVISFAGENYLFHSALTNITQEGGIDVTFPQKMPIVLF